MRKYWSVLLGLCGLGFLIGEVPALGRPKPADPQEDGTLSAFRKWLVGIEPRHWRRPVLVPLLWLVCLWLPPHVSLGLGPSLRWGRGRGRH